MRCALRGSSCLRDLALKISDLWDEEIQDHKEHKGRHKEHNGITLHLHNTP